MPILETEHFVARAALPVVAMPTPTGAALRAVHAAGAGGFILADDLGPRFYLAGETLADLVDERHPGWPGVVVAPLVGVLGLRPVAGAWQTDVRLRDPGLVRVSERFLDPGDEAGFDLVLADPDNVVVPVIDRRGGHWGWVLNHEHLAGTVHTAPPSYVCSLDPAHRFADPDHGRCAYCPGALNRG